MAAHMLPFKGTIKPFWAVQLLAWPTYGLIVFIGSFPYIGLEPHLDSVKTAFLSKSAFTLAGFLSSSGMRFVYHAENGRAFPWVRMAPVVVALSYLAGLCATVSSSIARYVSAGHLEPGWSSLFGGAINATAVFLAWSACYFAICNYRSIEKEKRDALQSHALAHQAQLEMLRSQVNPHFLFNALNSIHALVRENPERARVAVEELSEFLRYSLTRSKVFDVPLSEEVEVLERYLALEKIRFEEKLAISIAVDPQAEQIHVPGFLLHPLLENSIKYGMQTSPMPLHVHVTAERTGSILRLLIANTGQWVDSGNDALRETGVGLGLNIVRQRLEQAFPGQYRFECQERNGWVENVIVIQLYNPEIA
jgi:two-component system LytT family sensor kinase